MLAARCCHSSRSSGSSGTGPRARSAHPGVVPGRVLADPFLAGVHRGGEIGEELVAFGVGDLGHLFGPGALRLRDQRIDLAADAGVDHACHVPGPGERPGVDRLPHHVGGVQPGGFGGPERPP